MEKKLALKKETLRRLNEAGLRAIKGQLSFKHSCAGCESRDPACTLPPSACLASCSCSG